jgi:hypothetical protein
VLEELRTNEKFFDKYVFNGCFGPDDQNCNIENRPKSRLLGDFVFLMKVHFKSFFCISKIVQKCAIFWEI